MIGVSLLPGLSQRIRDAGMSLTKPTSARGKKRNSQVGEEFPLRDLGKRIVDAINRATQ